jgi:glycosyltransferase involved in cell wall biosynthesis
MEKRIVNVASYNRINSLVKSIESIYDQCDEINICLNNHTGEMPDILYRDKINLFFTDNSKGDAFKFLMLEESDGYFLTIDDDLIYPNGYVDYMVNKSKEHNNSKIITLHGRSFSSFPIVSYYKSASERYACLDEVKNDVIVQFGGTGVMCFHTSLLKVSINDFLYPNMADVWIGKFAKQKNIPILCLQHSKGYIKYIPQTTTIYDESSSNDKIQTLVVNNSYGINKKCELSVIIPTFNNVEYIDECINSIMESSKKFSVEILVGIDGCQKTLNYVIQKKYLEFIRFYYFNSNNGPYDIKNTLSKVANSDKLVFFDSDDIMGDTTINEILNNLNNYDLIKLKYQNSDNGRIDIKPKFGEGVFAIKKSLFLNMNGFEPWFVAADSDFMARFYKNNNKIYYTKNISFIRRLHSESLTHRKDTGMSSSLRGNYFKISKNKKGDGNPDKLHTRDFVLVDVNTIVTDTKNYDLHLLQRKSQLDKVLNPVPRKVVGGLTKKPDPVIKERVEILYNNPKPLNRVITSNKPDNRQDLINLKNNTNKSINKELFGSKPNRRTGINPIKIGGKSNK